MRMMLFERREERKPYRSSNKIFLKLSNAFVMIQKLQYKYKYNTIVKTREDRKRNENKDLYRCQEEETKMAQIKEFRIY